MISHEDHRRGLVFGHDNAPDRNAFRKDPTPITFKADALVPLVRAMDRQPRECAWPYERGMCCGRRTVLRKSYCESHLQSSRPVDYAVLVKRRIR